MPYRDPYKHKERQRLYYRNRRAVQLANATRILGGVCVGCGTRRDLEFDHIDQDTKKFDIGQRAGCVGWARIREEALKCRLLCRECHTDRTTLQRRGIEWTPPDPWDRHPDPDDNDFEDLF